MKWPGEKAAAGAVLQVQVGTSWATREFKDWWGLFRLLETGRITPLTETKFRVQWDLVTPDAQTVEVQYVLKSRSYKNPFRPGLFEQFRCVYQL